MTAPTHHTRTARDTSDSVEIRLPWWAVALPAIAFAALLLLIVSPGEAHAVTTVPTVDRILQQVHQTLSR
jgi:hypothetical protein